MNFNKESYEKAAEQVYEPMKEGWYTVQVCGTKDAITKSGDLAAQFDLTVIGDSYKGRKLMAFFNVNNPSEKTRDIAYANLRRFAEACHLNNPMTSEEFLMRVCDVYVVPEPKEDGTGAWERIKKYRESNNSATSTPVGASAPVTPPWGSR